MSRCGHPSLEGRHPGFGGRSAYRSPLDGFCGGQIHGQHLFGTHFPVRRHGSEPALLCRGFEAEPSSFQAGSKRKGRPPPFRLRMRDCFPSPLAPNAGRGVSRGRMHVPDLPHAAARICEFSKCHRRGGRGVKSPVFPIRLFCARLEPTPTYGWYLTA